MGYVGNLALVAQVDGYTREDVSDIFVGMVADFGTGTAPDRWLVADGSAVSRTSYPKLFARLGTTWGAGDGSTTFNLPDLRETVTVGTGTRGAGVTAHDTYDVGEFKDDQMQGHWHDVESEGSASKYMANFGLSYASGASSLGTVERISSDLSANMRARTAETDGPNGTPRTGTTNHGKQAGVLKCIFGGVA